MTRYRHRLKPSRRSRTYVGQTIDQRPAELTLALRESAAGESVRSPRGGRAWLDTRAVEAYDVDMSVDTMDAPRARNVLIVANRTAATPALLAEVGRRASEGVCRFTLLVPRPYWDADTEESAITLELAIPLLEDAAGGRVEGLVGSEDPFLAASAALEAGSYDEVIISTLPAAALAFHVDARGGGVTLMTGPGSSEVFATGGAVGYPSGVVELGAGVK
jgi:hypothetical protein